MNNRPHLSLEALENRVQPSASGLSGYVFADGNNTGVMQPGETGLAGATVKLTGITQTGQNVNASVKTDANGFYSFSGLNAGTYTLSQAQAPSGYVIGQSTAGASAQPVGGGVLTNLSVGAGITLTNNDFGDLATTAGWTSIASNFNGTAIPAGDTVWYNAALKVNGLTGSNPVTLKFTGQTITYSVNGSPVTVNAPNSVITFAPGATASTTFDASTNTWNTTLPFSFSGNGFLGGVAVPAPNGLPGGINPVTWSGQFSSDTPGISVNWQWAAAVYTDFSSDYSALSVKPVDDNHVSAYQNSDHAGAPEAFTSAVVGGARGGGGSNYTGSYSATASASPPVVTAPPASISGSVDTSTKGGGSVGVSGITIELLNSNGAVVGTTKTALDGSFSFTNLAPGTYSIQQVLSPTSSYTNDASANQVGYVIPGTPDGTNPLNLFSGIVVSAGQNGMDYTFADQGNVG